MSKKILKGPMGLFGKKKKKAAADDGSTGPTIAALSPEETARRKLLPKKQGLGSSRAGSISNILDRARAQSGTLGG